VKVGRANEEKKLKTELKIQRANEKMLKNAENVERLRKQYADRMEALAWKDKRDFEKNQKILKKREYAIERIMYYIYYLYINRTDRQKNR
jgi:hypothetical protein